MIFDNSKKDFHPTTQQQIFTIYSPQHIRFTRDVKDSELFYNKKNNEIKSLLPPTLKSLCMHSFYDKNIVYQFPHLKHLCIGECNYTLLGSRVSDCDMEDRINSLDCFSYNKIQVDELPLFIDHLTHLSLACNFNKEINNLPKSLTHLSIGSETLNMCIFDQSLDNLPSSLHQLYINSISFNQPVNKLPATITHLTLLEKFNHPVNNLPPNLRYLRLGDSFNQEIDHLPHTLILLKIGDHYDAQFNRSIAKLPSNLTHLSIMAEKFQPIDGLLPPKLQCLVLSHSFNQALISLPPTLTHLSLDASVLFNKSAQKLPSSITHLDITSYTELDESFNSDLLPDSLIFLKCDAKITFGHLPKYLCYLSLSATCDLNIIVHHLPKTITHLHINADYPYIQHSIPITLPPNLALLSYWTDDSNIIKSIESNLPSTVQVTFNEHNLFNMYTMEAVWFSKVNMNI